MKHSQPHILLLNPWITDFAAYNLWVRPLGLLNLASLLRESGFRVTLIDCLDFSERRKKYGDGKFYKTRIEKPGSIKSIPRNYSKYGIPEEMLLKRFSLLEEKPDLIGITSGMTYWYPGLFKLIEITKHFFKNIPVILGGIYAAICYEHAKKYSGADVVFKGGNPQEALRLISELTGFGSEAFEFRDPQSEIVNRSYPAYPAFDLYSHLDYVCISTSRGCPFHCTYCATPILTEGFIRKDPFMVVEEIEHWTTRYSVKSIAFYDDALLIKPDEHIIPIMREVIKRGIQCTFHAPNGLHVAEIDKELADLLFRGGFKTIRLGFETSNEMNQVETGGKVDNRDFGIALKSLKNIGYSSEEIGVYIMAGLPGQRVAEVKETISLVRKAGAKPILTEYSPIPGTPMFERAKKGSSFDLENEPLFHNNSILPCQWEGFTLDDYKRIKTDLRRELYL